MDDPESSIIMPSRIRTLPALSLFLGIARFANRDCGATARLQTREAHRMEVVTHQDIALDGETVNSGGHGRC